MNERRSLFLRLLVILDGVESDPSHIDRNQPLVEILNSFMAEHNFTLVGHILTVFSIAFRKKI